MLKPALAAIAIAITGAVSSAAEAHDANDLRNGWFGAPFFYDFARGYDDRSDRGRDVERHYHTKNGKRVVHAHPFRKGHDHGRGWSDAKRFKDKKDRYVHDRDRDRRDYWRGWDHRRDDARDHDHRRDDAWSRDHRHDGRYDDARRDDGRHGDARDQDRRREAQRQDARERAWRESRDDDRRAYEQHQRDEYRRWQERQRRND